MIRPQDLPGAVATTDFSSTDLFIFADLRVLRMQLIRYVSPAQSAVYRLYIAGIAAVFK